jgi:hypothetical protein
MAFRRTCETFLEWFEVEAYSMGLDLQDSWLIPTESGDPRRKCG